MWIDDVGPCGAVSIVDWGDRLQADVLAVPDTVEPDALFESLVATLERHRPATVEVPAREDDHSLLATLTTHEFLPADEQWPITWMNEPTRPSVADPPDGFTIVARVSQRDRPHPMVGRNGEHVESRLRECPLYDPELDLAVNTPAGDPAGYALFWMDPTTGVGMLEPMRVEDGYHRMGLARSLLTAGLDLLAIRGARRIKVTFARYAGTTDLGGAFTTVGTARMFTRTRL